MSLPRHPRRSSLLAVMLALVGPITPGVAAVPAQATGVPPVSALPGREADGRVAQVAFRLATAGVARCPAPQPATGIVLQHLSQFRPADRPGMIAALGLDRGPAVIAVVPGSPAAAAGVRTGDILLAIDGTPLPPEPGLDGPFSPTTAHARIDAIDDLLARPGPAPLTLTLTVDRDGAARTLRVAAVAACPPHVDLARSPQRNAYADGRHVFLTTGLVALATTDDELAFILAHEMAHDILGHAAIMRSGAVKHGLGRTLGTSGAIVRDLERRADALGGELMIDAGYDPVAGILARLTGVDLGIDLFAAHDGPAQRIAAMRTIAQARGVAR